MKLGLISDVHEHDENLRECLRRLQAEGVDQIVMLGDVYELGHRIQSTCELLAQSNGVGVWGNHDFGLCVDPTEDMRTKFGDDVMTYMTSLKPALVIEDCYFAHIEPWLDPKKLEDLWYFDGIPKTVFRRQQIFDAMPHRLFFAGHYHRWLLVSPERTEEWDGSTPVCLKEGRYFIVINTLIHGAFATYDTATGLLIPHHIS
jgi:hypothetical protein